MRKQRVFLSFDFSRPEIDQWFREVAEECTGGEVEVVTGNTYRAENAIESLKKLIQSCDAFFSVFTSSDKSPGHSSVSPWVITETTFARDMGMRVAALREQGIKVEALGLAVDKSADVPEFDHSRNKHGADKVLSDLLRDVVQPRVPFVTQSAHKTIEIKRIGWVHCEMQYKQIVFRPADHQSVKHCIWRTHQGLDIDEFNFGCGVLDSQEYLDAWRLVPGSANGRVSLDIREPKLHSKGTELSFSLDFGTPRIHPFRVLQYGFAWGYKSAFFPHDLLVGLEDFPFNATGLRAGTAGTIRAARVELKFQRLPGNLDAFELPPSFAVAWRDPTGDESSVDHFRRIDTNGPCEISESVKESVDQSTAAVSVFEYDVEDLQTTIRALWKPSEDYHIPQLAEEHAIVAGSIASAGDEPPQEQPSQPR